VTRLTVALRERREGDPARLRAVAPRAAQQARIAFFCGPTRPAPRRRRQARRDAARSRRARRAVGRRAASDPVRLGDEARSTSLFGGTRHILVRAHGDEAHDAVENLLGLIDSGEGEAPARC
jgi:DNA polymerase-3 subunit delta